MKKIKIKGYICKSDLTKYVKGKLDPLVLDVWKDKKELRKCAIDKIQVKKVEIKLINYEKL